MPAVGFSPITTALAFASPVKSPPGNQIAASLPSKFEPGNRRQSQAVSQLEVRFGGAGFCRTFSRLLQRPVLFKYTFTDSMIHEST
jgi:hypothetical protein